ncbi:copper transporter [Pullulanibacillus camelliae]|uniref:Copper transporter n=1 Tax=Pullulanibacillus camelliae TaxID=1707096 RepID=A0A8J2YL54_9BACL|nr:copper resistance protein CopC [Pullulanibacillus camelliae]GGE50075.1 copper transporter [Pullulanibacillus camelliae]
MKNKVIVCIVLLLFVIIPQTASAHAHLLQATPNDNEQLKQAPDTVKLTFNERLQPELYYIKVYDSKGKLVSTKTKMSADHTTLSTKLKTLAKGTYTVNYHIISADTHPVEASYLFSIGQPLSSTSAVQPKETPHQDGIQSYILYAIYYFLLLSTLGWLLISVLRPSQVKQGFRWLMSLKIFLFIVSMLVSLGELSQSISGFNGHELNLFLFHTTTGSFALVRVCLALIVLCLPRRLRWFNGLAFIAFILLEALSGHAISFSPKWLSVILDAVHLIGAAFWVGGLLYIALHWKRMRESTQEFLPFFSKGAFISLVALVISGILETFIFLPSITEIIDSTWGILLLLKTLLVIGVFITAFFIRKQLNKQKASSFLRGFKIDFLMMLAIIVIVGAFTHMSPIPQNKPLDWKTDQNGFVTALSISPRDPGVTNRFQLTVRHQDLSIQNVHLILRNTDKGISGLDIPLKRLSSKKEKQTKIDVFQAQGNYLTLSGHWELELQILDNDDNYTVLKKDISVYPNQ